jgi:MobA-like NTP transferase domain
LVHRVVDAAKKTKCSPIVVVIGSDCDQIECELKETGAIIVENENWPRGIGTSIRAGARSLIDLVRCTAILFSAKKPPERPKEAVWEGCGFLGETLQLVGELHLLAAVHFAGDRRNLIGRQIDFIGGSRCLTSSSSQVI